jgi:hypothetical protein
MAVSSTTSTFISDIEQQIAVVSAQLEQARAQQLAAAEKSYLAAEKAVVLAREKVRDLSANPNTTLAAKNRLLTATAAAEDLNVKLVAALEVLDTLKSQKKYAEKFAKKVGRLLAGKKIGKKIKFTKAENAIIKEDKKAAKKLAKAERKSQKKIAKDKLQTASSVTEIKDTPQEQTVKKLPVKKTVARKAPVQKAVVKKSPARKVTASLNETEVVQAPEEITPETTQPQAVIPDNAKVNQLVEAPEPAAIKAEVPIETISNTDSDLASRDEGVESINQNVDV